MSGQLVCSTDDIIVGQGQEFTLQNHAGQDIQVVVLQNEDGVFFACSPNCTHGDVPLAECEVRGNEVECWAHGAKFNLRTGTPTLPATEGIKIYPLEVKERNIFVDVEV